MGLKEGLVECATVCVKSVVILMYIGSLNLYNHMIFTFLLTSQVENDTCNEEKYITKQENKVVHDPN